MNDPQLLFALREWRRHYFQARTQYLLLGTCALLALTGPFGTVDLLGLGARLAYWGVISFLGYGWGSLMAQVTERALRPFPLPIRLLGLCALIWIGIAGLVLAMNALVFGWFPSVSEAGPFLLLLFAVCALVTGGLTYLSTPAPTLPEQLSPQPPGILHRLPAEKRGAVVALCVEDHYVRVITLAGETMLLMRLSDAIHEVAHLHGAQVHRSYWAAFDQVASAKKERDRVILTMTTGDEVPVSRANLPKIKEAGLWPR